MNGLISIYKRELTSYFVTPVAYVFIVIFLFMTGVFTFYLGAFYESNQADLEPFFRFHLSGWYFKERLELRVEFSTDFH